MDPTPEALQRKLYFLLEQLQDMARELPPKYQMRVPIELLSGLANCLLNETVFEIVKGLMEIQHVTEKHLFQQRQQIINKHNMEIQTMMNNTPAADQQSLQKAILLSRHREELRQTDMKLVLQLDQKAPTVGKLNNKGYVSSGKLRSSCTEPPGKQLDNNKLIFQSKVGNKQVSDQQVTLEKAGVPGFFVTNKPIEVKVQMYLLDFILRLSNMEI